MPITVPKSQGRIAPQGPTPSQSDLWMALAIMHGKGQVKEPTFDERFRGQDPASLPIDVQQSGPPVRGIPKGEAKGSEISSTEADSAASIGLMGGSR